MFNKEREIFDLINSNCDITSLKSAQNEAEIGPYFQRSKAKDYANNCKLETIKYVILAILNDLKIIPFL